MSLYISGQPIPAPMGISTAYQLLMAKEPAQNMVSVTYADTSPEAKQANKNTLTGSLLALIIGTVGFPAAGLAQTVAQKMYPKLENKFPYVMLGGSIASILGLIAGIHMVVTGEKKVQQYSKTFVFKNASVASSGNGLQFQRMA